MNISRTRYRINSLLPDGNYINILGRVFDPTSYSTAAIGETKEFEALYTLTAGQTWVGKTIYVTGGELNIGNSYAGGAPTSGYRFTVTSATQNNTAYNMQYIGCSNNGAQNEVFKCTITFTNLGTASSMTATIKVQQILSYSIDNYRACDFYDNQSRLLKSYHSETGTLPSTPNISSFYNNTQKIFANVFHVTEGNDYYRDEVQIPFQAGFYEKDPANGTPYFSDPVVSLEVDGNAATSISPVKNTKVTLSNTCPVSPDHLIAILVDVTDNDQSLRWWENYDYSAAEIITMAGAGYLSGYNSKFMSPSQNMTLASGSTYEAFFEIDYTQIEANRRYRIIWILYNLDPYYLISDRVNSFISDEFTANFYEDFDGDFLELEGSLSDYQREYFGNYLQVVPEERIKAKIELTMYDPLTPAYTWEDYLLERFGQATSADDRDIRNTLKQIDLTFYWTEVVAGQTHKHVVDKQTIVRQGINNYLLPSGCEFNSIGTDVNIPDFQDVAEISYEFRVRYEDDIDCIETYINNVLQPAPLATMDWQGKTIFIEWHLYFDYPEVLQTDDVYFYQKLLVGSYQNSLDVGDRSLDFVDQADDDIVICSDDDTCLSTELLGLSDYYLHIVNIDKPSHKRTNIEEEEVWNGVLDISTSTKLTSVDENYYYDNTAGFCVDIDEVYLNTEYKVSAIAKLLCPCTDGIFIGVLSDFNSYAGAQHVQLRFSFTGSLIVNWGDGTTSTLTSTVLATHQYTSQGLIELSICGDVDTISAFSVEDVEGLTITYIDARNASTNVATMTRFQLISCDNIQMIKMPDVSHIERIEITGIGLSVSNDLTLDLRGLILCDVLFQIQEMKALSLILFNSSVQIIPTGGFSVYNTNLDQAFNFGTNIIPAILVGTEISVYNAVLGGIDSYSVASLDKMIDNIYQNRNSFDNSGNKTALFNNRMPVPSGTLQAPPGYIQADGVTVGSDGIPTSAKEKIYVLVNQNINNTTTKKYNWTITTN